MTAGSDPNHATPDHKRPANRLAREKSPYLLQHAHNPVDWYPWGEEAFEKAAREDKPVFLSIGYSTCHWCHVMERESFEDPEVARLLNEVFVPVKVDREERPDLDDVYMTVCQMMTGRGGWPLTILMTADKRPFFAGTYFPKHSNVARIGLKDLTLRVHEQWKHNRDPLSDVAARITRALEQISSNPPGTAPGSQALEKGFEELRARFDAPYGGFGHGMKFPTPHQLLFLLRYWKRTSNDEALAMVEKTLSAMRNGGIFDHVGFGFHRYSTDRFWVLPHFEKMLYDQALIAMACTETFKATGKKGYARTARLIFDYVLRDMRSPEGAFYSAEDADSEGEEGKFYVWTEAEIRQLLLDPEEADLIVKVFQVGPDGNFNEEATGTHTGDNILFMREGVESVAKQLGLPSTELEKRLELGLSKLFEARKDRTRPSLDDKILTDWNGLMIAALARAARAFEDPQLTEAARRATEFVLEQLRDPDGRLLHRYREGEAGIRAYLDDYAFMIWALLELHQTVHEDRYLKQALELTDQMITHYWDSESAGFYLTADDGEELLVRRKDAYDGATPSGNSVAALNLLRLARITGSSGLEEKAHEIQRAFSAFIGQAPSQHTFFLCAVDQAVGPSQEVVVVGKPNADDSRAMLRALETRYFPNAVVLFKNENGAASENSAGSETGRAEDNPALSPFTAEMRTKDGRATAYVCRNHTCQLPVTDVSAMLEQLRSGTH